VKNSYRGLTLDQLEKLNQEELVALFRARLRRRFSRKIKHKYTRFLNKCRKSKRTVQPGEKPTPVKTHLRNAIIMPEMVGNVVGIYTGRHFANVEIKFDMIGRYLGEFAITYKPTRHGRPGVGATKGSQHSDKK
jgi:small subunit ribosomal protein S15e